MKIKNFFKNLLVVLTFISCNGQKKTSEIKSKKESSKSSIVDNFNAEKKLHFDSEKKVIYSTTFIKKLGKFTIYYLPISKQNIDYYDKFDVNNNIKPLYDELNSVNYYSSSDEKKIDQILKAKVKFENDFLIISTFIPKEYINIQSEEDFSIGFPFIQKYYKKEQGNWSFLIDKKIKNANEE
ncbi:hypothetical protein BWK59_15055, partial [Flavobacterium davisii]